MPEERATLPEHIYTIPPEADAIAHARRWQTHVDAGRIGTRLPVDPAIAVNTARTAAILSRRSGGGFRAIRSVSIVTFGCAGVASLHA